jgi:hypothetical protein
MTVDCQWIEKNLEALSCDRLSEEEVHQAKAHMETCESCRTESLALNAIDPLIKNYFRRELQIARQPRVINKGRVLGLGGAVAAVAALLLVFVVRVPQDSPVAAPVLSTPAVAPVASEPTPPPIKDQDTPEPVRAKPSAQPAAPLDRRPQATSPVTASAPDFLVTDPAGYSHSLAEYRGHIVVIGVWRADQTESVANIERLYKANAANSNLRLLAVSNNRSAKPAGMTFPVMYNEGSKLFGAQPGEFVMLDENGAVELRGSLVKDFDNLAKAIRSK